MLKTWAVERRLVYLRYTVMVALHYLAELCFRGYLWIEEKDRKLLFLKQLLSSCGNDSSDQIRLNAS